MLAAPIPIIEPQQVTDSAPRPADGCAPRLAGAVVATLPGADSLRAGPSVTTEDLLRVRGRLAAGHPDRNLLRARAIEDNVPLAKRLARRYAGRGERVDDLVQVAALALVKAVDGYDPDRTSPFLAYAVPTIVGALKRHFRDSAWGMRVPRSSQELLLDLQAATGHLTQLRGRPPTLAELADHLRVDIDVLQEAVNAAQVNRLPSLNAPAAGDDSVELIDLVGAADPRYAGVDDQLALGPLVAVLPPCERRIITMRFYDEMTQARIGAEIGISQMQVSRLLRKALTQLRVGLLVSADCPPEEGPTDAHC
jgi:RNA polymerase sigma-B factor